MDDKDYTGKIHPKKFSLWLLCLGILMLFAGLTSAYIVRRGDGNWFDFPMPHMFGVSTVVVLLSSVSMIFAFRSAKKENMVATQIGLFITLFLGLTFAFTQYLGWKEMYDQGLHFVNPTEGEKVSASFLIAIAAIHLVHVLFGLFYIIALLIPKPEGGWSRNPFKLLKQLPIAIFRALTFTITKKNTLSVDMCNTYWHFVGLLWVYLYFFLYFAPDL